MSLSFNLWVYSKARVQLVTVVELVWYDEMTCGRQRIDGHEVDWNESLLVESSEDWVDIVDVADTDWYVTVIKSDPHPARLTGQGSLRSSHRQWSQHAVSTVTTLNCCTVSCGFVQQTNIQNLARWPLGQTGLTRPTIQIDHYSLVL